jgi:hypothetical protein
LVSVGYSIWIILVADDANWLAIEKAEVAWHEPPDITRAVVSDSLAMPSPHLPTDAEVNPKPQAQSNFSDPDSHILKGADGGIQGYSSQVAVDWGQQVIVAIGVSN